MNQQITALNRQIQECDEQLKVYSEQLKNPDLSEFCFSVVNFFRPELSSCFAASTQTSGECAVQETTLNRLDLEIGDKLILESGSEAKLSESIKTSEYTVVGKVKSEFHFASAQSLQALFSQYRYAQNTHPHKNYSHVRPLS